MVLPISLTLEEQQSLRRQQRRAIGRIAERIHYVLLFARGYPIDQIAALYQVDARTVASWLERFRAFGVGGLDDLPRSGRPRVGGVAACAEASRCLDTSPEPAGLERTTWTRRLLGRHLAERFGRSLSMTALTRLIARLGFVFRRPKLTVKPLPETDQAVAAHRTIVATARALYPNAPHLYEDECDVQLLPVVRGQYQRVGQQTAVPTPGHNERQPVFGFLNVTTSQWHYWTPSRRRSVEFVACLHELYRRYPEGPIFLYLDNGSIHKSQLTQRWLANHRRFEVIYLPAYSGHKSNPVEKVWWALKAEIAANRLYPSLEAIQDAIHGFFASFNREAAQQLTARYVAEPAILPTVWVEEQQNEPLLAAA
jgi:transposase